MQTPIKLNKEVLKEKVGDPLREWILKRSATVKLFAEYNRINYSYLSQVLGGIKQPGRKFVQQLAKLGYDPAAFQIIDDLSDLPTDILTYTEFREIYLVLKKQFAQQQWFIEHMRGQVDFLTNRFMKEEREKKALQREYDVLLQKFNVLKNVLSETKVQNDVL